MRHMLAARTSLPDSLKSGRRMLAIFGASLLCVVTACSAEPAPPNAWPLVDATSAESAASTTPTPATTPSDTRGLEPTGAVDAPTSSPAAPDLPAPVRGPELDDPGHHGAIATVEYFFKAYDYAFLTGDIVPFKAVSGITCDFCSSVIERVEKVRENGTRFLWDGSKLTEIEFFEYHDPPIVAFLLNQGSSELYDRSGNLISSGTAEELLTFVALDLQDGTWVVAGVRWEDSEE